MRQETHVRDRAQRRGRLAPVGARLGAGAVAGVVLGGLLLAPTGAAVADETPAAGAECAVTSAELRWGVKDSFRNYISGSIANGEWTTENGARYDTPTFIWDSGAGAFAPTLDSGAVAFTGDVHFTGHDDVMRLDISNPEIEFTGPDSARLVLAIGSTDIEGAEPTYERVDVAHIDLSGYETPDAAILMIEEAPVRLTAEGATAMNGEYGSYVSGELVAPVSLTIATSGCAIAASTTERPEVEEGDALQPLPADPEPAVDEPSVPWLPIGIGAVALVAIGVTGGMLIAGRRKASRGRAADSFE